MILKKINDFHWLLFARVIQFVLSLVSLRAITYFLSIEQFGVLALLTSFRSFVGLFLINPIGQFINRHTHEWFLDKTLVPRLRYYNFYIIAVSIISFFLVFVWLYFKADKTFNSYTTAAFAMMMLVFFSTWNGTLVPMINMLGYRSKSAMLEMSTLSVTLICSILFCQIMPTATLWLIGSAVGFGVIGVYAWGEIKQKCNSQNNTYQVLINKPELYSYCLPLALSTFFLWFYLNGYRLIIDWKMGAETLGIFALSYTAASQMWSVIETLTMQYFFPYFFKGLSNLTINKEKEAVYNQLINTILPIYTIILAAMLVTGEALLNVLTDPKFDEAKKYIYFAIIFEWFRACTGLIGTGAQLNKRMSQNIWPYMAGGIASALGVAWSLQSFSNLNLTSYMLLVSGFVLLATMIITIKITSSVKLLTKQNIYALLTTFLSCLYIYSFKINPLTLYHNLILILGVGILTALIIVIITINNPSYKKLISIKL